MLILGWIGIGVLMGALVHFVISGRRWGWVVTFALSIGAAVAAGAIVRWGVRGPDMWSLVAAWGAAIAASWGRTLRKVERQMEHGPKGHS